MQPFYRRKHILITGGMGFLGSNLAHALVRLGAHVTLYDALLPEYGGNPFNIQTIKDDVSIIKKDIRDEQAMKRAVKHKDVIFNIAAQTSHVDSMENPFLDLDINCGGQLTLLEACRHINPNVKIVYAGSRAQYGAPEKLPVTEDTPMIPIDIYGAHKIAGEHYHFLYQRICGLHAVSLRLTNIYGIRHQMHHAKYGVQNYLVRLAMDNKHIPIYGRGKQLRDFLYIDDAVDAFLRAGANTKINGKAFVIGSGQPIPFIDFVKKAIAIAGSGKIHYQPFPDVRRRIETGDFVTNPKMFQKQAGWKPVVSLEEGLEKTIRFYRQYKQFYW